MADGSVIDRGERWSLAGATALVTGGSKGIGHTIVEELAAFGVRVHTCSRSAADLEACRRRWSEMGLDVTVTACDLAVRADRERLMETVKATFDGKLDILVNNAAQLFLKPVAQCTAEDFSRCMATNLESCFHLCQLAHPLLLNASLAGGGSVVNVSSIGSLLAYNNITLYGTAKGRTRISGTGDFTGSDAEVRGGRGGGVGGVFSEYASIFLCHWPSHSHRRRPDHKCMSF
ncbi:tropinone reductase homolog At2g29360-like isoform X2 [Miscanthus floridulus]|uniref:tropinone reductase homolog At2g29360-like isoform X2 n=1 Tax=Miscanthus floridulus TaxID=154761 RepID=UPI00345966B2